MSEPLINNLSKMKLSQTPDVDVVADLANKDHHVTNSYFAIGRFETQDKKGF